MGGSHEEVVFSPRSSVKRRVPSEAQAILSGSLRVAGFCALAVMMPAGYAAAQVITIDTHGNATTGASGTVDRRFQQIKPTNIPLPQNQLDAKTRLELIRFLEADQGFAMRPFPGGHKGLTLVANGEMDPAGEAYLDMVTANGLCAKPGDRLVLSDVKIDKSKIESSNQRRTGCEASLSAPRPDRHGGPDMTNPVVQDDGRGAHRRAADAGIPARRSRTDRQGGGGTAGAPDFV